MYISHDQNLHKSILIFWPILQFTAVVIIKHYFAKAKKGRNYQI